MVNIPFFLWILWVLFGDDENTRVIFKGTLFLIDGKIYIALMFLPGTFIAKYCKAL